MTTTRGEDLTVAAGETLTVTIEYSNGLPGQDMKLIDEDGWVGDDVIARKTVNSFSGTITFEISRSELKNAKDGVLGDDLSLWVEHGPFGIGSSSNFDVSIGPSTVIHLRNVPTKASKGESVTVTAYGYSTKNSLDVEIRDNDGGINLNSHDTYKTVTVFPEPDFRYFTTEVTITPSSAQDGFQTESGVEVEAVADGKTSSIHNIDIVKNQPPSIDSISASPDPAAEGQVVSFSGSVSDPEGASMSISVAKTGGPSITGLSASLDNGQITGEFIAPEVSPGSSKTVDLEFTLSDGSAETTKTISVNINNAQAAIVDTNAPSGTYQQGDQVKTDVKVKNTGELTRTFYVGYGVRAEGTSQWRSNDGTTHTAVKLSPGQSKWVTVSWAVASDAPAGQYDVRGSVWEEGSTAADAELSQRLDNWKVNDAFSVNRPPSADAGGPYSVKEGGSVSLDASGSTDSGGAIQSTSWTVTSGPGSVSNGNYQAPKQLASDASATVKVTVEGSGGLTDSATAPVTISEVNDKPTASIKGPSSVSEGGRISLSSASSDPENEIVSTTWQLIRGPGTLSGNTYQAPANLASGATATVKLTVTDTDGASASTTTKLQVSASNDKPTASTSGPYRVSEDGTVTLTSTSSDPENKLASTSWRVVSGPGSISGNTYSAPNNKLRSDGTATVELTVTDQAGATDTAQTKISIDEQNDAPRAEANGDYSVTEAGTVSLDSSGSHDVDGSIQQTTWTVTSGPGSITNGEYQAPASVSQQQTATVRLTVTDDDGATGSDTTTITISPGDNTLPTAEANGDYQVTEAGTVSLSSAGSTDPDGHIQSTSWTVTSGPGAVRNGVYQAPDNELSSDSTATVQLTVTDNDGGTGTDTATITINEQNDKPTAEANGGYSVTAGSSVSLDASGSSDPEGSIQTKWTVIDGPGSVSGGTYHAPASLEAATTATVRLTVTDDDGATATDTATVDVSPDTSGTTPKISNFHATNPTGYTISVSFDASTPVSDIAVDVTEAGDPVTTLTEADFSASSGTYTATFNPGSQGTYNLTLTTAANSYGDGGTGQQAQVTVSPPSEYELSIDAPTEQAPATVDANTTGTITIETTLTAKDTLTPSELRALGDRLTGTNPPVTVTVGGSPAMVNAVQLGTVPDSISAGDTVPMTITATTPERVSGRYNLTVRVSSPPDIAVGPAADTNPGAVRVAATDTPPSISAFSLSNPSGETLGIRLVADKQLDSIAVLVTNESGVSVTRQTAADFVETRQTAGWVYTATVPGRVVPGTGTYTATLKTAKNGSADGATGQTATVTVSGTEEPTIRVADASTGINSSTSVNVSLTSAPTGLAGYNVTIALTNPRVATITGASAPSTYDIRDVVVSSDGNSVYIKAVDAQNATTPGATDIHLGRIEVTGNVSGTTALSVTVNAADTDSGSRLRPATDAGQLRVHELPCITTGSSCDPPTNVDGDPGYEDVNGNGRLDFDDVVTLFQRMNSRPVEQNTAAFDFNGNGRVDYDDIVTLFEEL